MDRKNFLLTTCAACGIIPALSLLDSCQKTNLTPTNFTIDLNNPSYGALNTIGGYVTVNNVFVKRTGASSYIALSQICTHQGCTVSYNSSISRFVCPCHGGEFDTNGNVVAGPPPSALGRYTVTQSGTTLTVKS